MRGLWSLDLNITVMDRHRMSMSLNGREQYISPWQTKQNVSCMLGLRILIIKKSY